MNWVPTPTFSDINTGRTIGGPKMENKMQVTFRNFPIFLNWIIFPIKENDRLPFSKHCWSFFKQFLYYIYSGKLFWQLTGRIPRPLPEGKKISQLVPLLGGRCWWQFIIRRDYVNYYASCIIL